MSESPPAPEAPADEASAAADGQEHRWQVETGGERLDVEVSRRLDTPRNRVQRWIREGRVSLSDGVARRASRRVERGQWVAVTVEPERSSELEPDPEPIDVLWEDEHLLFLDKPPGLVVHPAPGHSTGTLSHRLIAHAPGLANVGHPQRPGIVHRLDAGTSGVMVVAKTTSAYDALSRAFAERRVDKRYLAFCHGRFKDEPIEVDLAIGRHPKDRKRMAPRPDGRPAQTTFTPLREANGVTAVAVQLHTGRTHQIRVHLKALRRPLIGDAIYGEDRWRETEGPARRVVRTFERPALHAWRLRLNHPLDGTPLEATASLPEDLRSLWSALSDEALPGAPPDPSTVDRS
ncbi:MAG: RluA family pseudouridine synthase [Acidobacteriota bacterium]